MTARVLGIGTAVPERRLAQAELRDFFARQPGMTPLAARLVRAAFDESAIDGRHTVLREFGGEPGAFFAADGGLRSPSTGERNGRYREEAPALFAAAATAALRNADVAASEVTQVLTVSCTGCFAPGPDFLLVRDLGLDPRTPRAHLGFMGCAAAFPALRAAQSACLADPATVVLVVSAEVCSLHLRASTDPEQIVSSAVFADGAAAAVVAGADRPSTGRAIELGAFTTQVTSEGEPDMDWTIGDAGFDMRLSARVPKIIGREIAGVAAAMFEDDPGRRAEVAAWAVHPGGKAVLDRVQAGLGLDDADLAASRAVLRQYGNMSSATILFILQRLLGGAAPVPDGGLVAAMCFGPGLTVETAMLTVRRAEVGRESA